MDIIQIVLGTSAMEVTPEPTASNSTELLPKAQISGVYPIKINTKPAAPDDVNWKYKYDTMIIIDVVMSDETHFSFDVQDVSNQAGWTPNLAGQQQAVADINAWL